MPAPRLIAFDADDTLWPNQPHFDAAEARLHELLSHYGTPQQFTDQFFAVQRQNLPLFGYGAKPFMLGMIETVLQLTDGQITGQEIQHILDLGKRLLDYPIELLPDVADTLAAIKAQGPPLMLLTKGDLFDQESKLARSGLGDLFDHVEIVSEKNEGTYQRILDRHNVRPEEFVMVGNSLKSDVLPVARLGGHAAYVPYYTTWAMERVSEAEQAGVAFRQMQSVAEVPAWLRELGH